MERDARYATLAALAWACEMTSLESAADGLSDDQVLWADFDRLLDGMVEGLARVAAFFGMDAPDGQLQAIASGPLMTRYSKALEFDYSPDLRRQLLEQAAAENGAAIEAALKWLDQASLSSPLLRRALDRATS